MQIGIIGQGYVGTAIKAGFEDFYKINAFDKYHTQKNTVPDLKELIKVSDIIFICVPTPMKTSGESDTSIVEHEVEKINKYSKKRKIVVIKSTIPPGTTKKIKKNCQDIDIIFNPEFLTEVNFIEDFKNQNRIILGGGEKNSINILMKLYRKVFPETPIINTDSTTAEMVKYLTNTFLATKVSFANEMAIICRTIGIDYNELLKISLLDQRLGNSHWAVPGPDGKLGFSGSCFPKDLNALIYYAQKEGVDLNTLKGVWETNLKIRPEKDWLKLHGRAVVKKTR